MLVKEAGDGEAYLEERMEEILIDADKLRVKV